MATDIEKMNRMQLDLLERDRKIRSLEEQLAARPPYTCPICGARVASRED
jgi:hypothetical protein